MSFPTELYSNYTRNTVDMIAGALNTVYTPLLIILGTIGNLLSVIVFLSTNLRLQPTSQYLSALAVTDNVFLLLLLPPWLNAMDLAPWFHQEGWCQAFVYLSYVSSGLSSWLVVAFTIERFVAVLYPLRRNQLCTVSRARFIIATLAAVSMLLNAAVIRFATPNTRDCNIDIAYIKPAAAFNVMETVLSFTLPLSVIFVLNILIIRGINRLGRAHNEMALPQQEGSAAEDPPQSSGRSRPSRPPPHPRSQQRITRMLLLVSWVFVGLNLPAYTMRILAYAFDIDDHNYGYWWNSWQQIVMICFNTNFGINFLLYCLSGQKFRRELMQGMPWWRVRGRRQLMIRLVSLRPACSSASALEGNNYNTIHAGSTPDLRPRNYIKRWTFDNSRQRAAAGAPQSPQPQLDALEMTALRSGTGPRACSLTRGRALARDSRERHGSAESTSDTYF